MKYGSIEDAGFSTDGLREAKDYFDSTNAVAMLLVKNGYIVDFWGDIERKYKCHSIRKSVLNALYGLQVKNATIDIGETIGEIGINEKVELTKLEKSAQIKHLLTTRSGIYLEAALQPDVGESPKRGSYKPGEKQYYNNWDFNVLGTIYNEKTGSDIFVDFDSFIAKQIGMQDFDVIDGTYEYDGTSLHPGYPLKMSACDLARFGQLYLQMGNWNGKQIIDTSWVEQSFTPYTVADNMGNQATGYGYLWWIQDRPNEPKRYFALGWGEQYLGIFPEENIIIVLRADSYFEEYFKERDREQLIKMIFEANISKASENTDLVPYESQKKSIKQVRLSEKQLSNFEGEFELHRNEIPGINDRFKITYSETGLIIEDLHYVYKFRLIPIAENEFFIEDIELYLTFKTDKSGNKTNPEIRTFR